MNMTKLELTDAQVAVVVNALRMAQDIWVDAAEDLKASKHTEEQEMSVETSNDCNTAEEVLTQLGWPATRR